MSDDEILARVNKEKTRFIVVRDPALKERLSRLGFLRLARDSDEWVAYEVEPGAVR